MCDENIQTTLRGYVGHDAEAMAGEIWASVKELGTFIGTKGFSPMKRVAGDSTEDNLDRQNEWNYADGRILFWGMV